MHLWDTNTPHTQPLQIFAEHSREAYSVHWNLVQKNTFVTGSWDNTIKVVRYCASSPLSGGAWPSRYALSYARLSPLICWVRVCRSLQWDPMNARSLVTFREHTHVVYAVSWSPYRADAFASCSGDNTVRVWDCRVPSRSQTVIRAHDYEVLSLDWNKYDENVLVSGSVDKSLRGWDVRNPARPLFVLTGHTYAIRRYLHGKRWSLCIGCSTFVSVSVFVRFSWAGSCSRSFWLPSHVMRAARLIVCFGLGPTKAEMLSSQGPHCRVDVV